MSTVGRSEKMNEIKEYTEKMFEDIKHIDENGNEYWSARELQKILEYKEWRKFEGVINKAKNACENSNINVLEQFVSTDKLSKRANNTTVKISDYKLTRYACYLIAHNLYKWIIKFSCVYSHCYRFCSKLVWFINLNTEIHLSCHC